MLNDIESIMSIPKSYLHEACKELTKDDITRLVDRLSLKDDQIRYQAFLLLQSRSALYDDVYPFWELFHEKLKSENSYQRSIGLMLIAENVKWDMKNKMENVIDDFMACLYDPKPIPLVCCSFLPTIHGLFALLCNMSSRLFLPLGFLSLANDLENILTHLPLLASCFHFP
jgi:hypothetical protein